MLWILVQSFDNTTPLKTNTEDRKLFPYFGIFELASSSASYQSTWIKPIAASFHLLEGYEECVLHLSFAVYSSMRR